MKAALIAAVLTAASAGPGWAQNAPAVPGSPPAPGAQAPADADADAAGHPAPGPIVLVSGSPALLERHGADPLHPEVLVCLGRGEEVVLASDRVIIEIIGEGCHIAGVAEQNAFADEQRALHVHLIEQAHAEHEAAVASGDAAAASQAHARLEEARAKGAAHGIHAAPIVRRAPLPATAARPASSAARKAASSASRTRTGAVRGDPAVPPRPIIFRLASASPAVLQRYPKGTLVQRATAVCLHSGEQATILGSNGQSVTYTGPGCLKRQLKPTGDNVGGFTFG